MEPTELPDAAIAHGLADFITAGVTPFHVVQECVRQLELAGFRQQILTGAWTGGRGGHFVVAGGTVIAWWQPEGSDAGTPLRIVATHTDSPVLAVKPKPETGSAGWQQLGVEVYGGPLWNSWLDRDLGLAGRLSLIDGRPLGVRYDRPLLRIPQLAPHLDRSVNTNGLTLNPQQHLTPIWGIGPVVPGDLVAFLADLVGVDPAEVAGHDLVLHDLTPPALLGRDQDLLAAPRLDNLASTHAGLRAITALAARDEPIEVISVFAAFDHEEIGSGTATGAGGPLLGQVISRIGASLGGGPEEMGRALAGSRCLSADAAHAVNPNYQSYYDPGHHLVINGGPALKFNANRAYGTDGQGAAAWQRAAAAAGIPVQTFVSRNDVSCGSTLGKFIATGLGIPTVDVGIPVLSMHSTREMCGVDDVADLQAGIEAFLVDPV